jgi:hypothetical protein
MVCPNEPVPPVMRNRLSTRDGATMLPPLTRADPRRLPCLNGLKCLKDAERAKLYIRE